MQKLYNLYGSWANVAKVIGVSPNYVRMCNSKKNEACFSLKLAKKAVRKSKGVTTIESLREKAEAKKLLRKNNNKK